MIDMKDFKNSGSNDDLDWSIYELSQDDSFSYGTENANAREIYDSKNDYTEITNISLDLPGKFEDYLQTQVVHLYNDKFQEKRIMYELNYSFQIQGILQLQTQTEMK